MLLEFSCANHKSIKDKILFSTIASKDTSHEDYLKSFGRNKILRTMAIYGPNGSGKSNFIDALEFSQFLVCNSMSFQPGQKVPQFSHKLNSDSVPSEYEFQFIKNDVRYYYGFSVLDRMIAEEYLFFFPNGRQTKIFERNGLQILPGNKYKKNEFEVAKDILKENRLFLSCLANYSNLKEVEAAFKFFMEDMISYNPQANNWIEYSLKLMKENNEIKKLFLQFMDEIGTGVKDIKPEIKKVKMNPNDLPDVLPNEVKTILTSGEVSKIDTKIVYDKFETDLMSEESRGIKKLFEIICPMIDILSKGKILLCDEIETGLHESIVHYIIETFNKAKIGEFAQLIFTTHDTSLLDPKIFRRDQIWFTQLDNERGTDLYSLLEIKNVRKNENLIKGYIEGKYGAIPMLNSSFFNFIDQ